VIHKLLPNEMMGVIFEEHAKLEWRAPTIDGRVCRSWRQIVLDTPRTWIYIEISAGEPPETTELRKWLNRSGSAPLYIRFNQEPAHDIHHRYRPLLHYLLSGCHTRIASLRLPVGDLSFFKSRQFPCLRLLDINRWYPHSAITFPVQRGFMPELRSLRLVSRKEVSLLVQGRELTQLEVLILSVPRLTLLSHHPQSLTKLMLFDVSVRDAISGPISGPMTFPSLTYLSLYQILGFKPYINTPCLVTYHEGWTGEPFSSPLPSLVEYGLFLPSSSDVNPARWHRSFPNVSRLSIRAPPAILISFFRSLSRDPQSLHALRTISARALGEPFSEDEQRIIMDFVRIRREVCQMDVILYFEEKQPFHIPIFFGKVSH
jgi:hypothetical protein